MSVPARHALHQGPVVAALLRGVARAASHRERTGAVIAPGPWHTARVAARPPALVRDYVRHVGGDPAAYEGLVPPHLFPQWVFPLQVKALEGVPYPLERVLNGGCRLEQRAPLRAGEPLVVATRLDDVDDDGRRAVLRFLATTGTEDEPEAVVAHLYAIVPLGGARGGGAKKEPVRVPTDARELQAWRLGARAGLDFSILTGDFNPVHWLPPYARAFGFQNVILHGFSSFARTFEGLRRALRVSPRVLDVRFTRPLVLPAKVSLFHADAKVWVGRAPGSRAFLEGTFER